MLAKNYKLFILIFAILLVKPNIQAQYPKTQFVNAPPARGDYSGYPTPTCRGDCGGFGGGFGTGGLINYSGYPNPQTNFIGGGIPGGNLYGGPVMIMNIDDQYDEGYNGPIGDFNQDGEFVGDAVTGPFGGFYGQDPNYTIDGKLILDTILSSLLAPKSLKLMMKGVVNITNQTHFSIFRQYRAKPEKIETRQNQPTNQNQNGSN